MIDYNTIAIIIGLVDLAMALEILLIINIGR